MRQYPLRGGDDQHAAPDRRQIPRLPLLELLGLDREPRRNRSTLVDPPQQLDSQLPRHAVVDELELADVPPLLEHTHDLAREVGGGDDDALLLVPHLRVLERDEEVREDVGYWHCVSITLSVVLPEPELLSDL